MINGISSSEEVAPLEASPVASHFLLRHKTPGIAGHTKKSLVLIVLVAFALVVQFDLGRLARAENAASHLNKGVRNYQKGRYDIALGHLQKARTLSPKKSMIPFYTGLIRLQQSRINEAITEWRACIALNPRNKVNTQIKGYLTQLIRMAARDEAKKEALRDKEIPTDEIDPLTIAIGGIQSLLRPEWEVLGEGITQMLIVDLSNVKDLKVIERERIVAILQEMRIVGANLLKPQTISKIGRFVGAFTVLAGTITECGEATLCAEIVLTDTIYGQILGTHIIKAPVQRFWELEKAMAFEILNDLGYPKKGLPPGLADAIGKVNTRNLEAMLHYSRGVAFLDQAHYPDAREEFEKTIENDPDFELAKQALSETPVMALPLEGIIDLAESIAESM
ncbi:CsgG/HfaB family protein [Thermodesulfobacteriota bacterium]